MLSRVIAFFRTFGGTYHLNVRLSYLDRKIQAIADDGKRRTAEIKRQSAALEKSNQRFQQMHERAVSEYAKQFGAAQTELKNAQRTIEKQEEALAATREQLRTAQEITIPTLVASHDTIISRMEAETAVHVMRATALKTTPGENDQ